MLYLLPKYSKTIRIALFVAPLTALAQQNTTLGGILAVMGDLLNSIIPILMILATVLFLWGIVTYLAAAGDAEKIKSARSYIIWGLVSLFVMVAVWNLVQVLLDTFGLGDIEDQPPIPPGPGKPEF